MARSRLLLVDDDPELTAVVGEFLETQGYDVSSCSDGHAAVRHIQATPPDLVILDLNMPGLDGLSVCRAVRPAYGGRILMLTAQVDDIDEVAGLETGADDYVRKPVKPRVLLARVRSLLRRGGGPPQAAVVVGPLRVDPGSRSVHVAGVAVALTGAEFDLALLLANHAGRILSRDELSQALRGFPWDGQDRSLDLRISRLRAKLVASGGSPDWIRSVRGEGYLLIREPRP